MATARVSINLGGLNIKLEQDSAYPDAIDDLCNRASALFGTAVLQAKMNDINIMAGTYVEYPDDEDEDEEEDTD
jgi:hypothetical protein